MVRREYSVAELPYDQFSSMYYPGNSLGTLAKRKLKRSESETAIASLKKIAEALIQHYPACAPLKTQLKQLELAVQSLKKWIPKD